MRTAIYLRQSEDLAGDLLAVSRQREDCEEIARGRGGTVVGEYLDNDLSASKSDVRRPDYDRLVADYQAGRLDAIVCWDLDRLTRQPRQLEDWIEAAEHRGLLLVTANGEADLSTDGGRLYARIKAAVARAEIERKSARQKRANKQRAQAGEMATGTVPFGFRLELMHDVSGPARVTKLHPAESAAIRSAYDHVLAGGSVASIAEQWNRLGLTSGKVCTGRRAGQESQWTGKTVRALLGKARNAGLREYHGEIVGPAAWEPIVSEDRWRAAIAELDGRQAREARPRNTQHLLSGIAKCGLCGGVINAGTSYKGRHSYRCREALGHVGRRGDHADDYVAAVVVKRLSQPDVLDLLTPDRRADVDALRAEADALRRRLEGVAIEFADGELTTAQLRTINDRVRSKLSDVEHRLADAGRTGVIGPLVGASDVQEAWDGLATSQQRAVIDALMTVTLMPVGRGARRFDPDTVRIDWRQPKGP